MPSQGSIRDERRKRVEAVLRGFEESWRKGERPDIDDYLDDGGNDVASLLPELVGLDLEYRLLANLPAELEDYCQRFPALWEDRERLAQLIVAEYELRSQPGAAVSQAEYFARFPRLKQELKAQFAKLDTMVPSAGTVDPAGKPMDEDDSPAAAPRLAGYEMLGTLGRGAMGVVYRARQVELDREVALKMVAGGPHAGRTELSRFRREAKSLARLNHPNIVQVYEVGDHERLPYFSMELVEGGGLDKHIRHMAQPRDAAELIEVLARAIHAAHGQGVVHRDLKPSNVLLAADGTPKIADFGLARKLEGGDGETRTGDVLGTPSYMSPEQGRGDLEAIGPATDVYALGAILYEALTGRPPFRGESAWDTVGQILTNEPVAPRRLQPKLPRDLETICLKCLEKEPAKRYASAEELADDLRRFLAGEPVHARPATPWRRLGKWVKRRPAATTALVLAGVSVLLLFAAILLDNARLRERSRAVEYYRTARTAVDQMLVKVSQDLFRQPRMQTFARDLMRDALRFYRDLARQQSDDPELRFEIARAHRRMGEILRHLEEGDEAEQSLRKAVSLSEDLVDDHPLPVHQQELAASLHELSLWLPPVQRKQARQLADRAAAICKQLADEFPKRHQYQRDLASIRITQGLRAYGDEKAVVKFREAVSLYEALVAEHPEIREYGQEASVARGNLAAAHGRLGDHASAAAVFQKEVDYWQHLLAREPDVANHKSKLALNLRNLGQSQANRNAGDKAEESLRRAILLREELVRDYPDVPHFRNTLNEYRDFLRKLLSAKAKSLVESGDHAAAAKTAELLPPVFPDRYQERLSAAWYLAMCVSLAQKDQKLSDDERNRIAEDYAARSVELFDEAVKRGYTDLAFLRDRPELEPLRSRPKFQQLVDELARKLQADGPQ